MQRLALRTLSRLQGRPVFTKPRGAGTNFRNGCLFGTSMLINGRLGRQLSLVLSGIAKGRGAGFLLVMTRSAKMMADCPPLSQAEAASSPHECSARWRRRKPSINILPDYSMKAERRCVCAPNAHRVVGPFNKWDGRRHAM